MRGITEEDKGFNDQEEHLNLKIGFFFEVRERERERIQILTEWRGNLGIEPLKELLVLKKMNKCQTTNNYCYSHAHDSLFIF